jgi:serine O-acetyltransferase
MVASTCRLIPHLLFLAFAANRSTFQQDLYRWAEIHRLIRPSGTWQRLTQFVMFMTFTKEFRNIFYLRFGPASRIFAWLCPRLGSLDIAPAPIGPGLFIQHGEGTYVSAESIGCNCWIGRQVVIGYSNETDRPVIGDDVRILAGAKIIGQVRIGDGATIGLNTVIMQDVPAGATMLGIPGKMIWRAKPVMQDSDFRTLRAVN